MNSVYDYIDIVTNFNSLNSFQINTLYSTNYKPLLKYTDDITYHFHLLKKYLDVINQGFNDDNLAAEIGLFVYSLNRDIDRLNEIG